MTAHVHRITRTRAYTAPARRWIAFRWGRLAAFAGGARDGFATWREWRRDQDEFGWDDDGRTGVIPPTDVAELQQQWHTVVDPPKPPPGGCYFPLTDAGTGPLPENERCGDPACWICESAELPLPPLPDDGFRPLTDTGSAARDYWRRQLYQQHGYPYGHPTAPTGTAWPNPDVRGQAAKSDSGLAPAASSAPPTRGVEAAATPGEHAPWNAVDAAGAPPPATTGLPRAGSDGRTNGRPVAAIEWVNRYLTCDFGELANEIIADHAHLARMGAVA